MGCAVSCVHQATMSLLGKNSSNNVDARAKLERKLYLAKESPEPDFDLSDCQLKQVPSGVYAICKVYRKDYLYLHDNNISSLENGGQLSDLCLIKVLNISANKFLILPNDIRYLVNLTELYMQHNFLKSIPGEIQYLQCLQILDVSNNHLLSLTPSMGKLKSLTMLNVKNNIPLKELCSELCFASNLSEIQLDGEQFIFPPAEIATQDTEKIMRYLCNKMHIEYIPPVPINSDSAVQLRSYVHDPFAKRLTTTWEEQEAAIIEQENKMHEAAKQQREKFMSKVLQEQSELDCEIAKVHVARDVERQRLIKTIQDEEKEIECLVRNFIKSEYLRPEIIQQQLAHDQAEHDRLLEITRQNYDNIKKSEVLKAMEKLIEEDYSIQHSQKSYEDNLNNMKHNMLLQEIEGSEKINDLLKAKDQSRGALVQQLLEDQDIQKAIVASLIERVDARSWSLNQEISLISSHLARLSVIEQEKRKLQVSYNYNELLHQRMQLVNLLDDLMDQQSIRRAQLIETMREMEKETDSTTDFWLKSYQKLITFAPKSLLDVGKSLDPVLANFLLQEGVIHCLPFLVKFLFSQESLLQVTAETLKVNGVTLSSDREGIIRAINYYVGAKSKNHNYEVSETYEASAPTKEIIEEEQNCTGVVDANDIEKAGIESECVICMDARCEVVIIPCGHMCCCLQCADKEMDSCPMCRGVIERKMKVVIA